MSYRVILRSEVLEEIFLVVDYISENSSEDVALAWYQGFDAASRSLSDFPHRCELARESDEYPDFELRQLIYKSHRLIFTVRGNEVHVLHVRHGAQEGLEEL